MARRRKRKKKNPSTAQIAVLAVGSALGLGLVSYGIYLAVKKPAPSLPPEGLGGVGPTAPETYSVFVRPLANGQFQGYVVMPNGRRMPMAGAQPTSQQAYAAAAGWVRAQGGTIA